jgi:hypothetical protein
MNKKIIFNFFLIIGTYILPFYFLNFYQESVIMIKKIQVPLYTIILFGSIILTFFNYRYIKQMQGRKILWFIFFAIGIIGVILSVSVLFLLFIFRNGIGF